MWNHVRAEPEVETISCNVSIVEHYIELIVMLFTLCKTALAYKQMLKNLIKKHHIRCIYVHVTSITSGSTTSGHFHGWHLQVRN